MRHRTLVGLLVGTALALGGGRSAVAELNTNTFIAQYDHGSEHQKMLERSFIQGLLVGMGWVNTDLKTSHRNQLFCLPDHFMVDPDHLVEMVRGQVTKKRTSRRSHLVSCCSGRYNLPFPCSES
jgi:hypothetical protein